jgi:hypothetical protein
VGGLPLRRSPGRAPRGSGNLSSWAALRLVASAWDRIERRRRSGGPGPWLAKIDSAGSLHVVHHAPGETA